MLQVYCKQLGDSSVARYCDHKLCCKDCNECAAFASLSICLPTLIMVTTASLRLRLPDNISVIAFVGNVLEKGWAALVVL